MRSVRFMGIPVACARACTQINSPPPPRAAANAQGFPATKPVPSTPSASSANPTPTRKPTTVISATSTPSLADAGLVKGDSREAIKSAHRVHTEEWKKRLGHERHRGWGTLLYEMAPTVSTGLFAAGGLALTGATGIPSIVNGLEFLAAFTATQRVIARGKPCPKEGMRSLKDKVAVVTGASSGMGLHVASALLEAGGTVIVTHNTTTAEDTRSKIMSLLLPDVRERLEGDKTPKLIVWPLRLQDRGSILKFCNSVKKQFPNGLDLLVNNAGNMMGDEFVASNGIEHTIDVSFVGPYALTETLLPHVYRVGGRVVYVSSHSHRIATTRDAPDKMISRTIGRPFSGTGDLWYHRYRTFSYAKFGNVCHAESLKRRGIKVVTVNPGKVNTNLRRVVFPYLGNRYYLPGVLWQLRTPEEGAQTTIYACLAPDESLTWGGYYHNCALLRYGKSQFVEPAAEAACDWAAAQSGVPVTKLTTYRRA